MLHLGQWSKGVLPRRELEGNLASWIEISGKGYFVNSSKEKEVRRIKVRRTIGRYKERIKKHFRGVILLPYIIQMGKGKLALKSFPSCHEDTELELRRLGQILCSSSM
nr:hypothetical protein CFP56_19763 [Quercus suber]